MTTLAFRSLLLTMSLTAFGCAGGAPTSGDTEATANQNASGAEGERCDTTNDCYRAFECRDNVCSLPLMPRGGNCGPSFKCASDLVCDDNICASPAVGSLTGALSKAGYRPRVAVAGARVAALQFSLSTPTYGEGAPSEVATEVAAAFTDSDGMFMLDGLADGTYALHAELGGAWMESDRFEITNTRTIRIEIKIP